MSNRIQFRRGPTSGRLGLVPENGEPVFDTDLKRVYIGDGVTPGGIHPFIPTATEVPDLPASKITEGELDPARIPTLEDTKVAFDPQATAGIPRTVGAKLRDVVSVRDFGATGDGVTDDTAALQAAIDGSAGARLAFPPGNYKITSGLVVSAPVELAFASGATLDMRSMPTGTQLAQQVAITVAGTEESPVAITADVVKYASQITVTSTATLAAGDWIRVQSDQAYQDGLGGGTGKRGFLCRIRTIDSGTQLTLTMPSLHDFASASGARVTKLNPVEGVVISGGRILGAGFGEAHNAIYLHHAVGPIVDGVAIDGCEDTGVEIEYCVGACVRNCVITDCTSPSFSPGEGTDGVRGYGVVDGSSMASYIAGNVMVRCRHAVAGGGSVSPFGATVIGNESHGSLAAAYDCHEQCFDYKFIGNKAYGGTQGFVIRGTGTLVEGNTVRGPTSLGIQVKSFDITDAAGVYDIRVLDNLVEGCGSTAIQVWQETATTSAVVVRGNTLRDNCITSATSALTVVGPVKNVVVEGNIIDGVRNGTGTAGAGIYVVGNSATPVEGLHLANNVVRNTSALPINLRYVRGITGGHNRVYATSTHAFQMLDCSDVHLVGDLVDHSGPAEGYGIWMSDCSDVGFIGLRMHGNPAKTDRDGIRAASCTGLSITGARFHNTGRRAAYITGSNNVVITGCDASTAVGANGSKFEATGATNSVILNNLS